MKQLTKSANAESEKRAERFTLQLSGPYLRSESNNVTVFECGNLSSSRFVNGPILAGWPSCLFQPPRIA